MISARGIYTPMAPLHPSIYVAAPASVQEAWRLVTDIQNRWQVARDELAVMTDAVTHAKAKDAENAAKAVAAGKPIPKSLELQATEAVHEKQREVAALADLADRTEREFLEQLRNESADMVATFTTAADDVLTALLGALNDVSTLMNDYSVFIGAYLWLRGDLVGSLASKRLTVTLNGTEQTAMDLLGWIAEDIRQQAPSVIAQREAERLEAWNKEMELRQTRDGLLVDAASFGAYS